MTIWRYSKRKRFFKIIGYLGVKIAPQNEYRYVFINNWMENNGSNPSEYFYQTVSYKLKSRFGDKNALINMIYNC